LRISNNRGYKLYLQKFLNCSYSLLSKFYCGHVKNTSLLTYPTPICSILIIHIVDDLSNTTIWKLLLQWHLEIILCMIFPYSHCNSNLSLSVLIMIRNSLEAALPQSVLLMKNIVTVSHLPIVTWHSFLPPSWAKKLKRSDQFHPWVFFGRYAIVSCEVIWSAVYIVISFA